MRQITVELDDSEMAALEAEAHIKRVEPSILLALKMKEFLKAGQVVELGHASEERQIGENEVRQGNGEDSAAARRAQRLAVLQGSSGIWPGEPGKPKDGVYYQEEMRSEWP
jgi:hypothetical protein